MCDALEIQPHDTMLARSCRLYVTTTSRPVSTTAEMPGMVMPDSATLVEKQIMRRPAFRSSLSYRSTRPRSSSDRLAYNGSTSVSRSCRS